MSKVGRVRLVRMRPSKITGHLIGEVAVLLGRWICGWDAEGAAYVAAKKRVVRRVVRYIANCQDMD